ncbi:ATP-binding protein [Candidatus Bathyarchaeota archaeon]|nr:ATP-binding protein [Candidatus Bathyarchaeota archaeon]
MRDEKQALIDIAGKQKDCEFSLKSILQLQDGLSKNCLTMLILIKKGARKEVRHDYGEILVVERILTLEQGLEAIAALYPRDGEKGKLLTPEHYEFAIEGVQPAYFLPSKQHGIVRSLWPVRCFECKVQQNQTSTDWNQELLRDGLPYYPDLNEAAMDFCGIAYEHFSSYGSVFVVVPDYRARIESLKLSLSTVDVKLDVPAIKFEDLVVKVFAKSREGKVTILEVCPTSDLVSLGIGFQPDRLHATLLSRQDNEKIDEKEFAAWRGQDEGIIVERPEEEILSLLRAGESQGLEYKQDVVDEKGRNDLIETVVAFLNTNSGLILVGVNNDGSIVGTRKNSEDLQRLIHDSCDPPPENIRIEEKEIEGNRLLVVDVPEGDDKPYQSKRDKNWYVRHNSNDMRMERSELMRFMEEKNRSRRYP